MVFNMTRCWIFLKCFFLFLLRLLCSFCLYSIYMVFYINWFSYITSTLHIWDKFRLVMVFNSFICCYIWFVSIVYFFMISASVLIRYIGLLLHFFNMFLVLVSGYFYPHRMSCQVFLHVLIPRRFCKELTFIFP